MSNFKGLPCDKLSHSTVPRPVRQRRTFWIMELMVKPDRRVQQYRTTQRQLRVTAAKVNLNTEKPIASRVLATVLTGKGIRSVTSELPQSPISTEQLLGSTHRPGFSGPRQEMHSQKGRVENRNGHRKFVKARVAKFNVPEGFTSLQAYEKYVTATLRSKD